MELEKKWVDLLVASTVGAQLALFGMSDPEGKKRIPMFHTAVEGALNNAWVMLSQHDDFSHTAFVETAIAIIRNAYTDFVKARLEWTLINGMPSEPVIIKPN